MSFVTDAAAGKVPVFGVDAVIHTASGTVWGVILQDVPTIEYTGERVVAKDGIGDDVARIYYNREFKSVTLNCWPVGADETAAIAISTLFKHGTLLQVVTSVKYPDLVGFWRVTQCQNSASNTDKKMVSLSLEWSIKQSWT